MFTRRIPYTLITLFSVLSIYQNQVFSQNTESLFSKPSFTGAFRFRLEQDWKSRKTDGSYRDDRTRSRIQFKLGIELPIDSNFTILSEIGSYNYEIQQDPNITLGKVNQQFNAFPIGVLSAAAQFEKDWVKIWAGKNSFPFHQVNELFWSNNIRPTGIYTQINSKVGFNQSSTISFKNGYFPIKSGSSYFQSHSYLLGSQIDYNLNNNKFHLSSGIFHFNKIPHYSIESSTNPSLPNLIMDYTIWQTNVEYLLSSKLNLNINASFLQNLKSINHLSLPIFNSKSFTNHTSGFHLGLSYGKLTTKNDWQIKWIYTYIEKYAVVDYFAQNDWARWSHGEYSNDASLSNIKGNSILISYAIHSKINVSFRYFSVSEIIPESMNIEAHTIDKDFTQTNQRIRFDIKLKI